jgi:hypothetical protein
VVLAGCAGNANSNSEPTSTAAGSVAATQTVAEVLAENTAVHQADVSEDTADAVTITLKGDTASADGNGVRIDGSTVTIRAAGTYVLSGELTGQVVVGAAEADVTIVPDGAAITISSTAALAATAVGELTVVLADGSENTLSDTDSYAEDADVNAALFSAGDLTIGGSGSLSVTGNDAIASKDGLVVTSGTITVRAADDGIRGKDYAVLRTGL